MEDGGFVAFCDREYSRLVGALTLWCGDRWVAEELCQEAFARAFRDWKRVAGMDAPGAWVRRVAINLATSRFRRLQAERRARGRLEARASRAHYDIDGAEVVAVRGALQRLPREQRTVLVLRYYLDLPIRDVAEMTGRSPSAVTSLTGRAAAALREQLGPGGHGPAFVEEARDER